MFIVSGSVHIDANADDRFRPKLDVAYNRTPPCGRGRPIAELPRSA